MRPISNSGRFSFFSSNRNPGLFLSGPVGYNAQQKLPLRGEFQLEHLSECECGASLTSEAAMKRARPESKPEETRAAQDPSPTSAGESRAQRLARIKREIEAGTYETTEKLEQAIDRMFGTFMNS